jgi:GT2 family glycosyltransferase
MSQQVTIIIPAHNQLEYCRQCVNSLLENTVHPHSLVLVDNGSTDGVGDYFESVPGATVLHARRNLGFAGGVNLGMRHAKGHVLLLNSDTLLPREWLTRMVHALLSKDSIGMVGPMSNCVSGSQLIEDLTFDSEEAISTYADSLFKTKGMSLVETDRLVGFCLLIRDQVVKQVGHFDEQFGIGNFEDDDYGVRVRKAGFRLCIAEGVFVFHYGSRTFQGMGITGQSWDTLVERNQRLFEDKWSLDPESVAQARAASLALNQEACQAHLKGELLAAVRLFKQAIAADPNVETNYNDLGVVLWELNEQQAAYQQFIRAFQLNPSYLEARDNLVAAGAALGLSDDVARIFRQHPV